MTVRVAINGFGRIGRLVLRAIIENSKSDAKLLKVFVDEAYPRHIGPGVYDIHSPRVPSEDEIKTRIEEMLQ